MSDFKCGDKIKLANGDSITVKSKISEDLSERLQFGQFSDGCLAKDIIDLFK